MKRKIHKLVSAALAAAFVLSLAVFAELAPDSAQATADRDANLAEEINIIIDNNTISVLNPFSHAASTPSTNWVLTMIHDRLFSPGTDSRVAPELALSYETNDYRTFTITLRQGVVFHNGDPFTARDVVWTWQTARAETRGAAHDVWNRVVSATALNDHTVELVLNEVNVDFPFYLTRPVAGIVSERAMTNDPQTGTFIGTGAFMVEEFVSHDFVRLQRNDNYWGAIPPTQRLTLYFIPELSTRTILMNVGHAHLSFGTHAEDIAGFQANPRFTVLPITLNNPWGLSFNMNDPITGCIYFRRAVLSAIDRDDIAVVAAREWATGANEGGTFWGYATEFRNTDIPIIPRDLDAARRYLERSVWNGEEIEIAAAIITNIMAAEMIQLQLIRVGIPTVVNAMDPARLADHSAYENNRSQITMFSTATTQNAASIRHAFYPGGAQNRASFNDPAVTALFREASRTIDINARRDIYHTIQELVAAQIPYANIFWRLNAIVAASGVGGLILPNDPHTFDLRGIYMVMDANYVPNPHSPWAGPELARAAELGLIPTTLQPAQVDLTRSITRAEFAGIVVRAYESLAGTTVLPASADRFTDTSDAYVLRAYNAGLMVGVSATEFAPNAILNREQAATALTRGFKRATIPGWTFETDREGLLQFTWPALFADDANISYWARESVYFMAANGIILGVGNNMFAPRAITAAEQAAGFATATREQALVIALRMVENLG